MITFELRRLGDGQLKLSVVDFEPGNPLSISSEEYFITDGEFDQLMMEMCILIEGEPEKDTLYASAA